MADIVEIKIHNNLVDVINKNRQSTGTALQWFRSYLTGRTQRVYINLTYSDDFALPHGVPQGSCLGPLLFKMYATLPMYAGKLFEVVKSHLPEVHAYADDTQVYLSFMPDSAAGEQDAIAALQDCITDIRSWMIADRLKLNDDKTEFMIIRTRAQLDKVNVSEIVVGQTKVPAVTTVRNLGAWLDANLTMSAHINKTCQSVIYHLHNIRRIRKYLSYDDRKSIVQAVIMPRIDYCNSLLVGDPAFQLSKLQGLKNAAARLVSNVAKYDHITPTLVELHWLPVRFRGIFKIAMLAHKCIYGNAPEYLGGLIKVKSTSRYNLRSDGGMLLEDYSARSKKPLGDRAFKTAAPKIWNILQDDIRMQGNYNIFKRQLKTHYFRLAYNFTVRNSI